MLSLSCIRAVFYCFMFRYTLILDTRYYLFFTFPNKQLAVLQLKNSHFLSRWIFVPNLSARWVVSSSSPFFFSFFILILWSHRSVSSSSGEQRRKLWRRLQRRRCTSSAGAGGGSASRAGDKYVGEIRGPAAGDWDGESCRSRFFYCHGEETVDPRVLKACALLETWVFSSSLLPVAVMLFW
jgi:hypothetical protein